MTGAAHNKEVSKENRKNRNNFFPKERKYSVFLKKLLNVVNFKSVSIYTHHISTYMAGK